MPCSLCNCSTLKFVSANDRDYLQCTGCRAILLAPEFFLEAEEEKRRYSLHNNDVTDPRYIQFVNPIVEHVKQDFQPDASGLDFGCGTGPVITNELEKKGFSIKLYDPYFQPNQEVLAEKFDFIVCCEVMEHFQQPLKEFKLLRSLLKKNGKLYCKTALWDDSGNFEAWHYKNDPTHVIFYRKDTLKWIRENLDFTQVDIFKDHIVFST
ncbi:class I SAM-dependent methyltransferase [Pontixanthobacter gangjinensis]|uniref:Class I SAM-dependent methyltransferase n=1 Tax=Christiangramia aestuarii TaxID=1028746 RepID=A0A7K1LSV2_9FLAO|nr:class I SAM-dependent methyltransferase [Christiangramia aestuarii]MUP43570.1 class I SAM-dependent methyltransferase [Christiangramia aestuarii]